MDIKLFLVTFFAVFLAELGDKTQLACFAAASGESAKWSVFIGSSAALVLASAIAVIAGSALSQVVSPTILEKSAGAFFILFGIYFLVKP